LTGGRVAGTGAERVQHDVQALGDLADGQHPAAGGRQFDSQREAVEAPADLRDDGGVGVGEVEAGVVGSSALAKQRDGVDVPQRPRVVERRARWQRERRDGVAVLGVQRERLPAGGKDRERRSDFEQPAEGRRAGQ